LERLQAQAKLQLAARDLARPPYELLKIEPEQGWRTSPPSPLDVFLDLEGDRLAEKGGFDYLFGMRFAMSRASFVTRRSGALEREREGGVRAAHRFDS